MSASTDTAQLVLAALALVCAIGALIAVVWHGRKRSPYPKGHRFPK